MDDDVTMVYVVYDGDKRPFEAGGVMPGGVMRHYDVEFCASGQGYYHCSGGGGLWGGTYCGPLGEGHTVDLSPTATLSEFVATWKLFHGEVVWCSVCNDWLPIDGELCDHVHWDDDAGWFAGAGIDD